MAAPDSTVEEVRTSVMRYLRMYEEGSLTLGDVAAELAVMWPAYEHAMGGFDDNFARLLKSAAEYRGQSVGAPQHEFDAALTRFRRDEAATQ